MMFALTADPAIARFHVAIAELFGGRLRRLVLFGSRARGSAGPESDYDVAVFLDGLGDRWAELDRLAALHARLLDETGAFFDAKPYPADSYCDATPLMGEIQRESVEL